MKKLFSALMLVLLFPLAACANDYKEGTHYVVVADQVSAKPEVIEMFSFWCPHCYRYEPLIQEIKKKLPDGTGLRKLHVDFLRFASRDLQQQLTRAMYAAEILKVSDKVNMAIFEHLHKNRMRIASADDIRKIFIAQGVDGDKYEKALKSFPVNGKFNANQKELKKYQGKVTGVPAIIVNGKYKVETGSVKSIDELMQLINYLLKKKD